MLARMYNVTGCPLGLETVQDDTDYEIFNYSSGSKMAAEFSTDTDCELTLETIQDYLDNQIHYSVEEKKPERLSENCSLALLTVQDNILYEVYDSVPDSSTVDVPYTCHICEISMPLNSVSAHLTSNIHEMWVSVTKLASERLQRQSLEPLPPAQTPPPNTNLCQTCGVLVKEDHSCSVKVMDREVTLSEFLKMWRNTVTENSVSEAKVDNEVAIASNNEAANTTGNESDSSEYEDTEIDHDIEPGAGSDAKIEAVAKEACEKSSNEVPYANDDYFIVTSNLNNEYIRNEIMNRERVSNIEIEIMKYYEYIHEYMSEDQDCTHKIIVQNEDYLYIVTAMGDYVMVSQDNYHGFVTVNGRILCNVCRCLVRNKYIHIRTEGHLDKIRCPLIDQNCIRQLNLLWNHCVLCNEIIENVEFHKKFSETHEDALFEALAVAGSETLPVNEWVERLGRPERVECFICAKTLNQVDLRYHAASPEHKKLLHERRLQLEDGDPMFNHHYLEMAPHDSYYCRVCRTEISENLIMDHLDNEIHKIFCRQYRRKLEQSKIQCKVSSEDCVTNTRDSTTSGSDSTVSTINQLQKVTDMSLSNDPIISQLFKYGLLVALKKWKTCKICYISFADWQSHLQSVEHGFYFNIYMNVHKIEGRSPHYKCAPCNLPLAPNNVIDHIIEKNHNLRDTYMSRVHSKRPIAYMDSQTEGFIELTGVGNEVYCKACKYTFLNQTAHIYEHVRGATHRAYSGYKEGGNCNTLEEEKIDGPRALAYRAEAQPEHGAEMMMEEKNIEHLAELLQLQVELETGAITLTEDEKHRICNVCVCVILNDPQHLKNHVRDPTHIEAYNTIMAAHNIVKCYNGTNSYCHFCKVVIPETKEFQHLSSHDHNIFNLASNLHELNTFGMRNPDSEINSECKICRIEVDDLKDHNESKKHMEAKALLSDKLIYKCSICLIDIPTSTVFCDHQKTQRHNINAEYNLKSNNLSSEEHCRSVELEKCGVTETSEIGIPSVVIADAGIEGVVANDVETEIECIEESSASSKEVPNADDHIDTSHVENISNQSKKRGKVSEE